MDAQRMDSFLSWWCGVPALLTDKGSQIYITPLQKSRGLLSAAANSIPGTDSLFLLDHHCPVFIVTFSHDHHMGNIIIISTS